MSIDDVEAAIARLSDANKQAEAVGVDAELVPWAYCGRSVATRTFMTCPKQTCNVTGRSEWAAPSPSSAGYATPRCLLSLLLGPH